MMWFFIVGFLACVVVFGWHYMLPILRSMDLDNAAAGYYLLRKDSESDDAYRTRLFTERKINLDDRPGRFFRALAREGITHTIQRPQPWLIIVRVPARHQLRARRLAFGYVSPLYRVEVGRMLHEVK